MGTSNADIINDITQAVEELDERRAQSLVIERLGLGTDPSLVLQGVVAGLKSIGQKFERKEYFLLELIEGGELGKSLVDMITPHIPAKQGVKPTRIIIGAVKGDIHDIGKNLVATQLRVSGYEVFDLGVDVPSMSFIDKAQELHADIIALSAFLTTTIPCLTEVLDYLRDMGLRSQYKVIIGGGPTTQAYADQIGADGWAPDAAKAVVLCENLHSR